MMICFIHYKRNGIYLNLFKSLVFWTIFSKDKRELVRFSCKARGGAVTTERSVESVLKCSCSSPRPCQHHRGWRSTTKMAGGNSNYWEGEVAKRYKCPLTKSFIGVC